MYTKNNPDCGNLILKAQSLLENNSVPELRRLCKIGGFIIRDLDTWWDCQSYNRARMKHVERFPEEVVKIDNFVRTNSDTRWFQHVNGVHIV